LTINKKMVARIALGICIMGILIISPFAYQEIETMNYYSDVAPYLTYSWGPLGKYHDSKTCDLCKNREKYPELYERHIKILHESNISTDSFSNNFLNYTII